MVYAIIVPTIEFLFLGCGLTGLLHQNTYKNTSAYMPYNK